MEINENIYLKKHERMFICFRLLINKKKSFIDLKLAGSPKS